MSDLRRRSGPSFPYSLVCSITPTSDGWLTAEAKVVGGVFIVAQPLRRETFAAVIDRTPRYDYVAVNAPLGYRLLDDIGARTCDRLAYDLVTGGGAVSEPASLDARLGGTTRYESLWADLRMELTARYQRNVVEYLSELSFVEMNDGHPLPDSPDSAAGQQRRRQLLGTSLTGLERLLDDEEYLIVDRLRAAAGLWSVRRRFRHRATHIPVVSELDDDGIPMEILR